MVPGFLGFAVRIWQFLWTLIGTGLIGNVIAKNNDGKMGSVNFAIFALIISWLSLIYGIIAAWIPATNKPIIGTITDAFTLIITGISAIVLSTGIRVVDCHRIVPSKLPDDWIGFGSDSNEKRCREIQASTVFMWFLFIGFAVTTAFNCIDFRRRGAMGGSGGPSMTQIRE